MPAEVVLPKPYQLAEVLPGCREQLAVDVEGDPVDNPTVAGRAALRLPALAGGEPDGRQVLGDLRWPGHPSPHAATDEVRARIVLSVRSEHGRGGEWGGLPRDSAVVPVGDVAAVLVDGVVVDLVVERQLVHVLRAVGVGELPLEHHLVSQAMDIPQLALEGIVRRPHRHTRADPHLAVGAIEGRLRQILPPVSELADGVGNNLHHSRLERQIELLPGGEPLADDVVLVGECRPVLQPLAGGRRLGDVLPRVGQSTVLVPGDRIAQQRLPHRVMIEPRPPLRLGEERVDPDAREEAQFAVVDGAAEIEPGPLLVALLPLRLVELLEEVHVADPAGRTARLPTAGEILPMAPEGAPTEGVGVGEVAAIQAEIVDPAVTDDPGIEDTIGRHAEAEEVWAVVEERRPATEATVAQVVDVEVPVDAVWWPPPSKHLERIPAGQQLRAEDLVVLDLDVVDVEGRLLGVGCQHRPPQHRDVAEGQGVATAGDELLMLEHRLPGHVIDHRSAVGPRQRHLFVGELEFPRPELPGWHPEAARGQTGALGDESAAVDLTDDVGAEPDEPGVVVDRGENRGPGDDPRGAGHVVEHAHRLDHALSLSEDDVPLEIELQRRVG